MSESYYTIAQFYDDFTSNVDYEKRAAFLDRRLCRFGSRGIVLDAGCGTGTLLNMLGKAGYDMIGVDDSEQMLDVARKKNPDALLLMQDLCELDLYGTVQGAICMQDTLNHLENVDQFRTALRRISLFMESGSYFIFDMNTEYKHRVLLGENTYVYESDQAYCVWQNELSEDGNTVYENLEVFTDAGNGLYARESETIEEILLDDAAVEKVLSETGFETMEKLDGDSYEELTAESERIVYVVRKK